MMLRNYPEHWIEYPVRDIAQGLIRGLGLGRENDAFPEADENDALPAVPVAAVPPVARPRARRAPRRQQRDIDPENILEARLRRDN